MSRKFFYIAGGFVALLIAAWFILNWLAPKKVEERLRTMLAQEGREVSIGSVHLHGINYLALVISRKHVKIGGIELDRVRMEEGKQLTLEGDIAVDSILVDDMDKPMDSTNVHIGAVRLALSHAVYAIPGAHAKVRLVNFMVDSRRRELRVDTIRLIPTVSKLELGGITGHQMDFVEATSSGVTVEGLDVMGLLQKHLVAESITIRHSHIYVFRDRRLPLVTDVKPLPIGSLKSLPMSLRVGSVKLEGGSFTYEEFPKEGDKTGVLRIERLRVGIRHLINRPAAGDPDYVIVTSSGSLMGSGNVEAVMRMPLRKADPYKVEGAFHELDVTSLNPSAENLGGIHLESGMLNNLTFSFDMN